MGRRFLLQRGRPTDADPRLWATVSGFVRIGRLLRQARIDGCASIGPLNDAAMPTHARFGRAELHAGSLPQETATVRQTLQRKVNAMRSTGMLAMAVFACVTFAKPVTAQLPIPRLTVLDPPGGKVGSSVEVAVGGSDLEGLKALVFSRPGITAEFIKDNKFKVTIAADAASGPIDTRAVCEWGISNPRVFLIDRLEEQREIEPNNLRSQATAVPLNSVVNGTIGGRADVDYFRFPANRDQRIVVDCFAGRIDSRLDAVVAVFDPNDRLVARCQRFHDIDPRLGFVATQPGEFRVQLHDLVYNGSGEYFYRLAIHTQPMIDHVYPPVVSAGSKSPVTIFGYNLPGGQIQPGLQVAGRPLEAVATTIDAPNDPTRTTALSPDVFLAPNQAYIDGFGHRLAVPGGSTQPVLIGISECPVVLENEPNNVESAAQAVTVPIEYVGRCDRPGDVDWVRFPAKKDQTLRLEGIAERAGYPPDLTLLLRRVLPPAANQPAGVINAQDIGEYDDFGNNVGRLKFDTGTHDPVVDFKAPADGDYLIGIRDRYSESRGNARFIYRLRVAPTKPDFRLAVVPADENNPSTNVVRQGGAALAHVFALRLGGFAGDVKVEADGLPPGVSVTPVTIGPAVAEAPLVFKAEPNAPLFDGPVAVRGTAVIDGKPISHLARSGVMIWPQGANQPKPARLAQAVCLSVRENAPYLLTAVPSQSVFGQGSQLTLQLKLERRWADFVGKLTAVTAQNLPPNVNNVQVEIGEKQTEGLMHLYFPNNVPTGTYSFVVAGAGPVPFSKSKDPKAQKQPVNVSDPSLPITVSIHPRPCELGVNPNPPQVKVGQNVQVKVTVNRVNDYKGPVTLRLTVPPGIAGLTASDAVVLADKNEGVLTIDCAGNVPPGDKPFCTVRAIGTVNNQPISVDAQVTVKVVQ
jgi:hypothetical protein